MLAPESHTWHTRALLAALLLALAGSAPSPARAAGPDLTRAWPVLWDRQDPGFGTRLERALGKVGLGPALAKGDLGVALVDVTDLASPRVAALNGDQMFYAASLPKLAVMLAVFEKLASDQMSLDDETWSQLVHMIRESSNPDSTALMHKVGKPYIADVLLSPRYHLYDFGHGGGLWAGKDYAQAGLWHRDPLHDFSHGATAMQVARFFYLLETGRLVNPGASREMKRLLGKSAIHHKFVAGLSEIRPRAAIFRKSGTWRDHHADGALVERRDGTRYIAVALAHSRRGGAWLPRIIQVMDALIPSRPIQAGTTLVQAGAGG